MQPLSQGSQLTTFYHEKCIALAHTLVIKSTATADAMRRWVEDYCYANNLANPDEPHLPQTWRYYKHLAGDYHPLDRPMEVKSLDTLQTIPFTKEALKEHRATHHHYADRGEYYQALVEQYPDQQLLIDGICSPVDYAVSIPAENYSILGYQKRLVEHNEYPLIPTLELWVKRTMERFHSDLYPLIDPLYEGVKLGILAIHLPGMIISIREQQTGTIYAHSYHVWSYLGSYFGLDKYQEYLTHEQAMWLYRNIRYLDIHAGKAGNFNQLIYWLLTKRNIPLYKYVIGTDTSHLLNGGGKYGDKFPVDAPLGIAPNIFREQLNLKIHDYQSEENYYDSRILVQKENTLAERNDQFLDHGVNELVDEFKFSKLDSRDTKLLESTIMSYDNQTLFPVDYIGLHYWIWLAFSNRYLYMGTVTNPKNGEVMNLSAQEGFILFHYLGMRLSNPWGKRMDNLVIPPVYITDILFENFPWEDIHRRYISPAADISEGIRILQDAYPVLEPLFSSEAFYQMVDTMQAYQELGRDVYSRYEDLFLYGEMRHYVTRMYYDTLVELVPQGTTYGQYFMEKQWDIRGLNQAQCSQMVLELFSLFTGSHFRPKDDVGAVQRAMIAIMKRLSSYSVQFVSEVKGEALQVLDMPMIRHGYLSTFQVGNIYLIEKFYATWHKPASKERNVLQLSLYFDGEEDAELFGRGKGVLEVDTTRVEWHVDHNTITNRYIPLPTIAGYSLSTPTPPQAIDQYYLYNDTLYCRVKEDQNPTVMCHAERMPSISLGSGEAELNPGKTSRMLLV